MSGRITHSWDGTVLTISSDSGTSSMNLKGDRGCRGPQGPAGIIIDELGNIDWNGYATEVWVEEQLANVEGGNVDLTGYATETYVDQAIEAIPDPDLTNYALKTDIPSLEAYATKEYVEELLGVIENGSY